jgi:hypothetical protein
MKSLKVTFRNTQYKLIALTSAGMGLLAQSMQFAYTDAYIYKIAKEHPQDLRIEKQ